MKTSRVVPLIALVAGCGGGGIDWQLPCAGSRFDDGASVATELYEYEWDADGHLLLELTTDLAGTETGRLTQEWQGDVLVYALGRSELAGIVLRIEATVSGGRIQTYDYSAVGVPAYHEDWTWNGGQLDQIDRDFEDAAGVDNVEVYEDALSGYAYTVCPAAGGGACDRHTVIGAEYRGDRDHWTRIDIDQGDDGTIDAREDRELDRHGLVLEHNTYAANIQGELIQTSHLGYDRESDGTALSLSFEQFGTDPSSYLIEYAFECN
jgi:hypothetical protein